MAPRRLWAGVGFSSHQLSSFEFPFLLCQHILRALELFLLGRHPRQGGLPILSARCLFFSLETDFTSAFCHARRLVLHGGGYPWPGNLIGEGPDSERADKTWANGTLLGLSAYYCRFESGIMDATVAQANFCQGRLTGWSMMEMPRRFLFALCLLPLTLSESIASFLF